MNMAVLLTIKKSMDIDISTDNGYLRIKAAKPLSDKQLEYLKQHKPEIIKLLKNQPQKNKAYKFIFADNKGAGTHLTDTNEKQARQEFEKQFPHYDLASFNAVNTTAH